ncbi:MAG: aminoacyl-tRNA hydrolase [Deltaproteobacteria bacterium]|nr:aminoacyl-tRNA hydrolase [Deltaproteobacteria bacterium]
MIIITPDIAIDEREIKEEFVRASGPGGQNVNKVATAVQLKFDVANSPSLPQGVRQRLIRIAGKRMTAEGVLVIDARRYRTQGQNRRDARERLAELIRLASERPRPRKRTRPSTAAKRRRLEYKRRIAVKKKMRRGVSPADE